MQFGQSQSFWLGEGELEAGEPESGVCRQCEQQECVATTFGSLATTLALHDRQRSGQARTLAINISAKTGLLIRSIVAG